MIVDRARLAEFDAATLTGGGRVYTADGYRPARVGEPGGARLMRWANYLAGGPGDEDHHPSISWVIRCFLVGLESALTDRERDRLKPYAAAVVGTAHAAHERERIQMLTDYVHQFAPFWLDATSHRGAALETLSKIAAPMWKSRIDRMCKRAAADVLRVCKKGEHPRAVAVAMEWSTDVTANKRISTWREAAAMIRSSTRRYVEQATRTATRWAAPDVDSAAAALLTTAVPMPPAASLGPVVSLLVAETLVPAPDPDSDPEAMANALVALMTEGLGGRRLRPMEPMDAALSALRASQASRVETLLATALPRALELLDRLIAL